MKTTRTILNAKGNDIYGVDPDTSVFEAIKLMSEKGIGAVLVLNEGNLVGIMSERDYARKVILKGKSSKNTPVKDIMTSDVIFTDPSKTVEYCMALMTANRVRHLPVFDADELIGIVSIGDLVKSVIADQRNLILQLENYILQNSSLT